MNCPVRPVASSVVGSRATLRFAKVEQMLWYAAWMLLHERFCGAIRKQLPNAACVVWHRYCQDKYNHSQSNPKTFHSFPSVLRSVSVPRSEISKQELTCLIPAGVWANVDYHQWRATKSWLGHVEVMDVSSAEIALSLSLLCTPLSST